MLKVTVILCFCYLIKDVLPSTTGFGIKNNKKLRLCISKELKTDEIKNNCLVLGLEDSGVECVDGHNQLECLRQINNGSADFGVFNPEDLVAAQADDDATVIAEIRTSDRSFQRYVVAVVDHTVLVDRPGRLHAVLKGRVLCHPGTDVGQRSAYTKTLNGYLEFLVQQPSECSSDENRIKTLADYFGRSCKAGPWVPDRFRDSELKRQYSSLCAACGSGTCSAKDRYWGALGALACVVEVGEVAWAEMSQVESFFTGSFFGLLSNRDGPYLTPESFALLCPDYSSQAITNATESCVWLHQPWPAIVARGTKLLSVEKLTRTMASAETTSGFWRSALQVVLGVASATLTPLEYPITAVDYLSRARGFRDAYSVKPCEEKPKKTFKCRNGVIIPQYKVCDGTKDCPKGDDETFRTCRRNACAEDMFRCAYGGCLDADVECNGKVDCPDGSDEFEDLCEIIDDSTTEKPSPDEDITPTNIPTRPPRPHTRPPPPPTRPTTTTESNDKLCVLPPYPEHGTYVVTNRPDAVPGQAFDSVHYTVTCSKGYTIIRGKTERICFQGIWSDEIRSCERFCNLPKDPSIDYLCPTSKNPLDDSDNRICDTQEPEGTIVIPACKAPNYYFPGELRYMRCIGGLWDYAAKCYPECGYLSQPEDQLVFGGRKAERGELPWNTVVYSKKNGMYKQICGGSLVTTKAVVSAAHCFWDEVSHSLHPPANYAVAFGKIDRDYNSTKEEGVVHVQRSDVSEIHVPERYRGSLSNFADDLSVIIIEKPVVLNLFIRPVCIDFSILFEERQLREGSVGKIATWGQNKYEGDFKVLRVLKLPFIPIGECLSDSPNGFIEYISGDKFCAGYRNGSAICRGDSGGGLVFPETDRGRTRYYLRGVASTAPANANYCDQSWLTTFTQLSKHEKFLKKYISNVNGPPLPNSIFSGTQL